MIAALLLAPALASAQAHYADAPTLAPPAGYSHAVVVEHGRIIYLSGAVSADAHGNVVGANDFRAQATQAFENLRAELSAVGATPANLVKLNYYVVGLDHDKVLALREVRDKFRDECLIEIEGVAVVP